jgi:hypothetical protein
MNIPREVRSSSKTLTRTILNSSAKLKAFKGRKLTENKCGPKFGESLSMLMRAMSTNTNIGAIRSAVSVNMDLMKVVDRTLTQIGNKRCLPPILGYADRDWGHIRISYIEYKSWTIRQRRVFDRILAANTYTKEDGTVVTWTWVNKGSKKGYLALKTVYSGWGSGANSLPRIP